jgi:O-antigen ligase
MLAMILRTQSRTSLVAAVLVLTSYTIREAWTAKRYGGLVRTLACVFILTALAVGITAHTEIAASISSALSLEDKYRGTDSGLAGRYEVWGVARELFAESPIFGSGYRLEAQLLSERSVSLGSVHNGYLAILVEVGIMGAIPFFAFVALRVYALFRMALRGGHLPLIGFCFVAGFLSTALVQPIMLNVANPLSALAWTFIIGMPLHNPRILRTKRTLDRQDRRVLAHG